VSFSGSRPAAEQDTLLAERRIVRRPLTLAMTRIIDVKPDGPTFIGLPGSGLAVIHYSSIDVLPDGIL
jgi:hypothetical protein